MLLDAFCSFFSHMINQLVDLSFFFSLANVYWRCVYSLMNLSRSLHVESVICFVICLCLILQMRVFILQKLYAKGTNHISRVEILV